MAKSTGLAWTTLSVDSAVPTLTDIRNDVTDFEFATPKELLTVTGVDKSAQERLGGLADFTITLNGVFNATGSHLVLRTVPSTDVLRTVSLGVASTTLSNECRFSSYDLERGDDAALKWTSEAELADGAIPTWG